MVSRTSILVCLVAIATLIVAVPRSTFAQAPPDPPSSAQPPPTPPPTPPAPPQAPPAPAPAKTAIDDARSRMEKGQRMFADSKYTEAADEFSAAYDKHKYTAFLFNAGVAAERGGARDKAIDHYQRFLAAEPNAPDRAEIEKTIERLRKEAALSSPTATSQKAEIKSLVFLESEPAGAPVSIYERIDPNAPLLDAKKPEQAGYRRVVSGLTAPTNVSLNTGTYFILVEGFRDYNPTGSQFAFDPGRVYVYRAALSQGDFVGRVEINLPVTTAQIFIDDPPPHRYAPRAVGPTSLELAPGKHRVWVEATGFDRFEKEIDIVQGQTIKLDAQLTRVTFGYLLVTGTADEVQVEVDGDRIGVFLRKRREPLRIKVPAGQHDIDIDADGMKAYESTIKIPSGQEVEVNAKFEESPGKGGAIVTTILAAGSLAGGIVLNRYVAGLADGDSLKDPLFGVEIGCFIGAGVFAGLSIFLFVWDPGDDSTAKVSAPREFTGETDLAVKPRKGISNAPRSISVGLMTGSLPTPTAPPLPVMPVGLSLSGQF